MIVFASCRSLWWCLYDLGRIRASSCVAVEEGIRCTVKSSVGRVLKLILWVRVQLALYALQLAVRGARRVVLLLDLQDFPDLILGLSLQLLEERLGSLALIVYDLLHGLLGLGRNERVHLLVLELLLQGVFSSGFGLWTHSDYIAGLRTSSVDVCLFDLWGR